MILIGVCDLSMAKLQDKSLIYQAFATLLFFSSLSLYLEWCYNNYKSFTTEILRIDMLVVKQKIK